MVSVGDPRLSPTAKDFFDKSAAARRKIVLTPISLAEVVYLIEKNRLPASAFDDLRTALNNPNHVLEEAPFSADVVQVMRQIPRNAVPEMPDRIIAATAVFLGVPLTSCDHRIGHPLCKRSGDKHVTLIKKPRRENLWVTRTFLIGQPGAFQKFGTLRPEP